MMIDGVKRFFVIFLSGFLIAYGVVLALQKAQFFTATVVSYGVVLLVFLSILFIMITYGIYPMVLPKPKLTLFFIGVFILFAGHYVFLDNAETHIYMGDAVTLYGVLTILFGATGVIITAKVKAKKQELETEVIEV